MNTKPKDYIKLNIITPVIPDRIPNLYAIKKDIDEEISKSRFSIQWYVFFDFKKDFPQLDLDYNYTTLILSNFYKSFKGNTQRNIAADLIKDGYICYMDDDNKFHPYYFDCIYNYINYYSENFDVFIGAQFTEDYPHGELEDGILKVGPHLMQKGKVDGHQITFKKEILGDLKWNNSPSADGEFIEALYEKCKDRIFYIEETICYHNYFLVKHNKFKRNIKIINSTIKKLFKEGNKWIKVRLKA